MKYPKQIYVRVVQNHGEDDFLLANEKPEEFVSPGEVVDAARYQLVDEVVMTAAVQISVAETKEVF